MFNNNKVNMIISLLCAIALWFYVVGQVDPQTEKKIADIPIEFINEDSLTDYGLAVSDIDYDTAVVTVKGSRGDLSKIDAGDIRVTADLRDLHRGTNTVTLKASVPRHAELVAMNPETVDIIVQSRVTESKPVEVKFRGETEDGSEPGNISISPDNVQVTGAESQVAKVESVVATVDLDDVSGDQRTLIAKVKPVNKDGKKVSNISLSTDTVEVTCEMLAIKEVDLKVKTVGKVPDDIQVDKIEMPDKVFIRGEKDILDDIDSITAADVDISSVKETTELPLDLDLPYGVERAEQSLDICVKVIVKELASHELEISSSNVKLEGVAEGLTATMEEIPLKVTVKGSDEDLETLTEDDIVLTADLSEKGEGTHTVKIKVSCLKEVSDISVSPEKAEVTLRGAE